nr:alpha N terminal protein methyltransferase 1A [Hymenolepis microstoma]
MSHHFFQASSECKETRKGLVEENVPPDFYSKAAEYWDNVDPTINGMLGGLTQTHKPDIRSSESILSRFGPTRREVALDCGAGIGRITKNFLLPHFKTVDMVELSQKFLDASREYIGEESEKRIGNRFCTGLQDFTPSEGRYDVIWVQWVIGHLTISATVDFFRRCIKGLRPPSSEGECRSIIVLKDNVILSDSPDFDATDSSFMRTHKQLLEIFELAGLEVLLDEQQRMPEGICPIWAFVLVPKNE